MSVLKIDPPPVSDDPAILRRYIADLYEALSGVLYSLDRDNMSEEFMTSISGLKGENENGI